MVRVLPFQQFQDPFWRWRPAQHKFPLTLAHTRLKGSRASQNQIFCLDEVQSACVLRWSRCSLRQLESEGFKLFEPQGLSSQTCRKWIDVFGHSRKICWLWTASALIFDQGMVWWMTEKSQETWMLNLEHGFFRTFCQLSKLWLLSLHFFGVHLKPFYLALKYTPNLCFSVPQRSDLLGKSCAQIPPQAQEPPLFWLLTSFSLSFLGCFGIFGTLKTLVEKREPT